MQKHKMTLIYVPVDGNTPQIIDLINKQGLAEFVLSIEYRTRMKGYVVLKVPAEEEEQVRADLGLTGYGAGSRVLQLSEAA